MAGQEYAGRGEEHGVCTHEALYVPEGANADPLRVADEEWMSKPLHAYDNIDYGDDVIERVVIDLDVEMRSGRSKRSPSAPVPTWLRRSPQALSQPISDSKVVWRPNREVELRKISELQELHDDLTDAP
ncbi:hypothetical protein POSPLADRAFT_1058106 [Postia placenta MAD-698-R-SB12]|uniref:Uncharacterized protein n=1 Tax=Postia placenta MAD-698-R-SB12 TaxID=670580 RepID=A0A1X6MXS8_9APHY|nr:hypothetical protein POSPLADRAFT_1058106 [Postia placenta MAD-698-R-SB12]OSX61178.1 hypothetical protein POSPLADRAFT_1058106 [Postia placenta MAD-698-R-SB12]